MKISLLAISTTLCATAALASTPSYETLNGSGSTAAEVIFPAKPDQQIRVVGAIATSDKAASVLSFRTGAMPVSISASNAAGTGITVTRTNGLAPNDLIVIQRADGTTASGTIASFPASTNITLNATTGTITLPGDQVYKLGAATTLKCGAATVNYQGEAIFVGRFGRPIRCVLDGTSACSLDSVTARYE